MTNHLSSPIRGRTLLIAAAILWSLNGVIVKSPPLQAIPLEDRGWLLACYRSLFASVALLPLVNWKPRPARIKVVDR